LSPGNLEEFLKTGVSSMKGMFGKLDGKVGPNVGDEIILQIWRKFRNRRNKI
jgi:hypothetical protein